jgi:RHS repeat-associated protein
MKRGAVVMGRYEYDALGRRVKSHVDSQSPGNPNGVDAYIHYFYNSGWQELESRVSASENTGPESLQPTYQYVWSRRYIDAPVLRDKNTDADGLCDDERIYYLGDANFNITTLVNTGGDAVERYVYTPYGVPTVYDATWANIRSTSSYANAYTYTGRQLDAETGLYYYRARFYAPQLGRFASRDPIGYEGSAWSLFEYSYSRVTSFRDPHGLGCQITYSCTQVSMSDDDKPVCYYRCEEIDRKNRNSAAGDPDFSCEKVPKRQVIFESRRASHWPFCPWKCPTIDNFGKVYTHGEGINIPVIGDSRDCSQEECRRACDNAEDAKAFCDLFPSKPAKQLCKNVMTIGGATCRDFCSIYCTKQ